MSFFMKRTVLVTALAGIAVCMASLLVPVQVQAETLSKQEQRCIQKLMGTGAAKKIVARFDRGKETRRDIATRRACNQAQSNTQRKEVASITPAFDIGLDDQTAPLGQAITTWLCTEYNEPGAVFSLWASRDGGPARLMGTSGPALVTDPNCATPAIHTWLVTWTPPETGRYETFFCPVRSGGSVLFDSCTKHITTTVS